MFESKTAFLGFYELFLVIIHRSSVLYKYKNDLFFFVSGTNNNRWLLTKRTSRTNHFTQYSYWSRIWLWYNCQCLLPTFRCVGSHVHGRMLIPKPNSFLSFSNLFHESDYSICAVHTLSGQWLTSNLQHFKCKMNAPL